MLAVTACAFPPRKTTAADDFFRNPFNKDSAHHRPIGTGAIYAADDDPATVVWLKYTFGLVNSPNGTGYGFSLYQTDPSAPETTIKWNGAGKGASRFPVTLRLPPRLTAPSGGEGVVIIYDPATERVHDFFHWSGGANPTAAIRLRPIALSMRNHEEREIAIQ